MENTIGIRSYVYINPIYFLLPTVDEESRPLLGPLRHQGKPIKGLITTKLHRRPFYLGRP